MRRLVVEVSAGQLEGGDQAVPGPAARLVEKVRSLEMLHVLKMAPGELAAVARIELKDPAYRIEDIFPTKGFEGSKLEMELLDRESETISTYFLRVKSNVRVGAEQMQRGGLMPYLATPFEYRDGKLRVAFLGSPIQIKRYLAVLSRSRLRCRVVSLTDARFSPNSPVGRLTDKQRRVLIAAYRLGYYDVPRRITSAELATKLNLVKSTVSAHVRKAERRLLTEILSEL